MNLLADRLKFAKRELTALKTAHARGLGNIKVYVENAAIPTDGHETGIFTLVITIQFDQRFTAYPFVYLLPRLSLNTTNYAIQASGFNYTSAGFGASFKVAFLADSGSNNFSVISTSPITSIRYDWS